MEMGSRTNLTRVYFDTFKEANEFNLKLTEIDKKERPELYQFEGSEWCEPQFDEERKQYWVLTWEN